MVAAVLLKISGQVHGVGFRYQTREKARELGLTGWVRNAPGGTVEIFAQGHKKTLEEFITWARHGPSSALVENVSLQWKKSQKLDSEFAIL